MPITWPLKERIYKTFRKKWVSHPALPPLEVPVANPRWEQVVGGENLVTQNTSRKLRLYKDFQWWRGRMRDPFLLFHFQKFSRFSLSVAKFWL
jgi:hypothetical protein